LKKIEQNFLRNMHIDKFTNSELLPRMNGSAYTRHKMESTVNLDELSMTTPAGERGGGGQSPTSEIKQNVIQKLTQKYL
jgi:hypothetical protein